jgi:hypothetical protein
MLWLSKGRSVLETPFVFAAADWVFTGVESLTAQVLAVRPLAARIITKRSSRERIGMTNSRHKLDTLPQAARYIFVLKIYSVANHGEFNPRLR